MTHSGGKQFFGGELLRCDTLFVRVPRKRFERFAVGFDTDRRDAGAVRAAGAFEEIEQFLLQGRVRVQQLLPYDDDVVDGSHTGLGSPVCFSRRGIRNY